MHHALRARTRKRRARRSRVAATDSLQLHRLLERLVRVGVAQQEGDERAAEVLGREGHARVALEHGLDDLGPARRVELASSESFFRVNTSLQNSKPTLASSAFAWSTRPPPSTNTYGQFRAAFRAGALNTTPFTLQNL